MKNENKLMLPQIIMTLFGMILSILAVVLVLQKNSPSGVIPLAILLLTVHVLFFAGYSTGKVVLAKVLTIIFNSIMILVAVITSIVLIMCYQAGLTAQAGYPDWFILCSVFVALCCLVVTILQFIYTVSKGPNMAILLKVTNITFSAFLVFQAILFLVYALLSFAYQPNLFFAAMFVALALIPLLQTVTMSQLEKQEMSKVNMFASK